MQVLDTAGIRETEDMVEKIGVMRSQKAAESADLVLFAIDASQGWMQEDAEIYALVNHRPLILVINKIDLALPETVNYPKAIDDVVETAAAENQGIDRLERAILEKVQSGKVQAADMDFAINQRQAAVLVKAKTSLEQVQVTIEENFPLDFWTIDLRDAIYALGEITGEEVTESVLDKIFSRFCIGK